MSQLETFPSKLLRLAILGLLMKLFLQAMGGLFTGFSLIVIGLFSLISSLAI
jgi:hypothetical protein